ncbi:MAG: DnaJ C-terminal domain-containing protein [Actinomycetota bacterium]|nr:DnaJ C-terminal domain-containing protein [Actinomycetota bacterium]
MRKEWLEKDYYATLGVSKNASGKEIKKSFRKLAREFHPDNNPDDAVSEARFKEINEAYDTLSDEDERREYDHVREMGYFVGDQGGHQQYVRVEDLFGGGAGGGGGGFQDLLGGLGDLFGQGAQRPQPRPMAGRNLQSDLSLTFHEALAGPTKTIGVDGRTVKVKVPQGIADGTKVRLKGKGEPGANGGPAGDLFVRVHVAPHPIFGRSGKRDLTIDVPVTFAEAALGAVVQIPTLDGSTKIRVPAGTQGGTTMKVLGKGVETSKGSGDLLVTISVAVPTDLSDSQRDLLKAFRDDSSTNPREQLGV